MKARLAKTALVLTLFAAGIPFSLFALQRPDLPINLRGKVRFAEGGRHAENVLVRLEEFQGGLVSQVRTDRSGKFEFSSIRPQQYKVSASLTGYRVESKEVDLSSITNEYVIFTLMPEKTGKDTYPKVSPGSVLDTRVPKEAREEYEKGRAALLNDSDAKTGISRLEKAVKIYPDYLEAQLLLGTAYLDSKQLEKAESALKSAIRIDSRTPEALWALGELYRQKKNYPEAEKALVTGTALRDQAPQGHLALGRLYYQMGNLQKAGSEIGRTLQLNPKEAEAYVVAGDILLKAQKASEALEMYSEYLKLEPEGRWAEPVRNVVEKIKKALTEKQ